MINLQDLQGLKAENVNKIEENKLAICELQKANIELEAENRVFDKLIKLYPQEEVSETVDTCETTEV